MLVTKNEASRYLAEFIEYHNFFDSVFAYDDRSDDETVDKLRDAGWPVKIRGVDDTPFMEHEGLFRFNSWKSFEKTIQPSQGDWVLSIDADEFMITDTDLSVKDAIIKEVEKAKGNGDHSIRMYRREVWKLDETGCYLRTDGFWRNDILYRLFEYRPGAEWSKKPMGCGSAPTYVGRSGPLSSDIAVIHFGYTNSEDLQERFDRYNSLPDHGHSDVHIKSIIKTPQLERYSGPRPEWVDRKIGEHLHV